MKPFNLEAALAGAPVVTRDGRKVTQLHLFSGVTYPLYAIVDERAIPYSWYANGTQSKTESSPIDLFMATVKKKGWISIYPGYVSPPKVKNCSNIYATKEDALHFGGGGIPIEIEWEE